MLKLLILSNSNGLAIWHGCPESTHFYFNDGLNHSILNFIELIFLRAYIDWSMSDKNCHFFLSGFSSLIPYYLKLASRPP